MSRNNGNGKSVEHHTNLSRKQLANWARKMRIQPDSILAFQSGAITKEGIDSLAEIINKMGIRNVVILIVDDVNNMVSLNEDDMNKLGWFRVETLQRLVLREQMKQAAEADTLPPSEDSETQEQDG